MIDRDLCVYENEEAGVRMSMTSVFLCLLPGLLNLEFFIISIRHIFSFLPLIVVLIKKSK